MHNQTTLPSQFLDNGALKQGVRTNEQLFQIEQACGKKRCACSKADIPFFPDRSHTSHTGKHQFSYPGFQLTQCLSDRRCDMDGRYFHHFLINLDHTGMVRQPPLDIGRTVSEVPYPLPRRSAEDKAAPHPPYIKPQIEFENVPNTAFQN